MANASGTDLATRLLEICTYGEDDDDTHKISMLASDERTVRDTMYFDYLDADQQGIDQNQTRDSNTRKIDELGGGEEVKDLLHRMNTKLWKEVRE